MAKKMKIKKGDTVIVISGRDRGKKGEVLQVIPKEDRLLVQGVNLIKRHQRPGPANPGGILEKEATIHVSNVAHLDPASDKPTRVGFKIVEGERKVRVARRSGEVIDR